MRTASPWWFFAVVVFGLLLLFLGERALNHTGLPRLLATGIGALTVLGITALRALAFTKSQGKRRLIEKWLLLCHAGLLLTLLLYAATTETGLAILGLADSAPTTIERYRTSMTALWSILALVSLVPLFLAELALGAAQRTAFDLKGRGERDDSVDAYRVQTMAISGLTIALAAALLMTTCGIAMQRNHRVDASYFKTTSPGSATVKVVANVSNSIKVMLFFPEVNEVKEEVRGYFEALADESGNIELEEHDRIAAISLAKKYKVTKDGTVVIEYGDKEEQIALDAEMNRARHRLRTLDSDVHKAIMKVIRARRVAYMTIGHGEINHPESVGALSPPHPAARATIVQKILEILNYEVRDLGRPQGLMHEVPDDAAVVLVLGPTAPLHEDELVALDRYLARGGALLMALDPLRQASLGVLEQRLGVTFHADPLVDDKVPSRDPRRHLQLNLTRFSSHASVTDLNRFGSREGLVMWIAGWLADAPSQKSGPKPVFVINSSESTFADKDRDLVFDAPSEVRQTYNLAAVIEDPTAKGANAEKSAAGMRAMIFADADVFMDLVQAQVMLAQLMFRSAVLWLGGEEELSGEIVSEDDIRIKHTTTENVTWFYGTIVGAPLFVLGLGLLAVTWQRRSRKRRKV